MKKEIIFTLDWDYGFPLKSSIKGSHTKVRVAGKDLTFVVNQTSKKITIQIDLLDWYRDRKG